MRVQIPENAKKIINKLFKSGYDAYVVGGCVRDSIIGKEPHDWDICTSATPDEMLEVFKDDMVVPTGLKHGTITVMRDNIGYEVTTFRIDGEYNDHRRPDDVSFVRNIVEDLSRRDFTVNAIAYNDNAGFIDPYGGINDIANRVIRCVGNPEQRFKEDALRILRCIRFSSVLGYKIESGTIRAAYQLANSLKYVSKERITDELKKILLSSAPSVALNHKEILFEIIPELKPCDGFKQNTPWHEFDVLEHIMNTVDTVSREAWMSGDDFYIIRLAALLHDIAKPDCYGEDSDGIGHFFGHPAISADMSKQILFERFRLPNEIRESVVELILYHDDDFSATRKTAKRYLSSFGLRQALRLVALKKADILAHGAKAPNRSKSLEKYNEAVALETIIQNIDPRNECLTIKDLALDGNDIIAFGVQPGPIIGMVLKELLDMVLDEKIANEKAYLEKQALRIIAERSE